MDEWFTKLPIGCALAYAGTDLRVLSFPSTDALWVLDMSVIIPCAEYKRDFGPEPVVIQATLPSSSVLSPPDPHIGGSNPLPTMSLKSSDWSALLSAR